MDTPFPLKSVMPICTRAVGFLWSKEDREDAIQDSLEEILKYCSEPHSLAEAIVRKIAYTKVKIRG